MLTRLKVSNFQSLRDIDLQLEDLTVIVGPSSSGKTALLRSVRALLSNFRGDSFITRGQTQTTLSLSTDDGTVTLTRSIGGGGEYRVTGISEPFTQLHGSVPPQVSKFLRIPPTNISTLNFASQFDSPFLLTDSGPTVARVLGELTNVSTIFLAVKEANRRRLAANASVKARSVDLNALAQQAQAFVSLPERLKACDSAETYLAEAQALQVRLSLLTGLLQDVEAADQALARAQDIPPLPDDIELDELKARYDRLVSLVFEVETGEAEHAVLGAMAGRQEAEQVALEQQMHDLLQDAGTCPLCGQSTEEL